MAIKTLVLIACITQTVLCDTLKRSVFDYAPINLNFLRRRQNILAPESTTNTKTLFHIPDLDLPIRLINNFRNGNVDTNTQKINDVNNFISPSQQSVQQKVSSDKNQDAVHLQNIKEQKIYTPSASSTIATAKIEDIWSNIFNGKEIFTTPAADSSEFTSITTESTTESTTDFDMTTDEIANRIGSGSSQVVASLLG